MSDTWFYVHPPNVPLLKCELGQDAIDYLWERIKVAQVDDKNANSNLAGNITQSLYLKDVDQYFFKNHLQEVSEKYIEEYRSIPSFRNPFTNVKTYKLKMREFWVNFSKQHEFNPLHTHGGALSFVVWLNIPTESEDQHNLPISKNSSAPVASDFMFAFTNIFGQIAPHSVQMNSEVEGTMFLFPSVMTHQVYPFYESDGIRVSISGNLYFDPEYIGPTDPGRL